MTVTRKPRRKADHRTRVGRERSARTETRILEAALGVFAKMGLEAPKIDDFVQAAGVSRGTFYNYFESVEELLAATSVWTTREVLEMIEAAISELDGPALRFGVGLRLFFAWAKAEPVWCGFVARVWSLGGVELPTRDVEEGVRLGVFRAPSVETAEDMLSGGIRQALQRIASGRSPTEFGTQMTQMCLQALGTDPRRIAAVARHELPAWPVEAARRAGKAGRRDVEGRKA